MEVHYRELVTKAEAAVWFSVMPDKAANVVVFSQQATG